MDPLNCFFNGNQEINIQKKNKDIFEKGTIVNMCLNIPELTPFANRSLQAISYFVSQILIKKII
jgi:hypothetical protein